MEIMDDVKVKVEEKKSSIEGQPCRVCLSLGRKLHAVGEYVIIYQKLTINLTCTGFQNDIEKHLLCWECYALLRKVSLFQNRVSKAQEILQSGHPYKSLSSISNNIIVTCEAPAYIADQETLDTKIKIDDSDNQDYEDEQHSDNYKNKPPKFELITVTPKNEHDEHKLQMDTETTDSKLEKKEIKRTRWHEILLEENSKPKFKMITLDTKDAFKLTAVSPKDLDNVIQRAKEQTLYTSKKHRCDLCVTWFQTKPRLDLHNKQWHSKSIGPYNCKICKSYFKSMPGLQRHQKRHTYKYECQLCPYICLNKKSKHRHIFTQHKRLFQCIKCEMKFSARKEFNEHYQKWHRNFICDVCGMTYKMRYCIIEHIRRSHGPTPRPRPCKHCGKELKSRSALYNHVQRHHYETKTGDDQPRPAYCVECDKQFSNEYKYKLHLKDTLKHNPVKNKKSFSCPSPDCGKSFSKPTYMKDHYNLVHLRTFKYRCEQCDKNFMRNSNLRAHNRKVHEGIPLPKNKICYVCGRGFALSRTLSNHILTHTGERPHACTQCPATFTQMVALNSHLKSIHGKS